MSHFTVVVIVADAASPASAVRTAEHVLEPFYEELEVEEYADPLDDWSIDSMRKAYGLEDAPLRKLVEHMEDWVGHKGVIDAEGRLCALTTYNPKAKWDWYCVGGRWDGEYGEDGDENPNVFPLSRITADNAPFAFILPNGEWVERGHMGWFALVSDELPEEDWHLVVEKIIDKYRECVGVLVDCHI